MTKRISFHSQDNEQKIALCRATYFNLNGSMPSAEELCEMLGKDCLNDILRYLNAVPGQGAVVA